VSGDGHFVCLLKRMGATDFRTDWEPDRLAKPSTMQTRLWQEFAGEVLLADFQADRLRVRAERLYFIPEELPYFGSLRVLHPGVWLGTFKKERFEPAHPLALFLRPGQAKNVLDLPSVYTGERRSPLQAYLSGETIPSDGAPGWVLVSVDGWPMGWGKRVQGILKNHYPKGWQVYS
jgi:NOL1/NOP2/fmu family ribosome biogenesis protein